MEKQIVRIQKLHDIETEDWKIIFDDELFITKSHKEFFYLGAKAWNILPQSLRSSDSVKIFSSSYKNFLMESALNDKNYHINNCFDVFYEAHTILS